MSLFGDDALVVKKKKTKAKKEPDQAVTRLFDVYHRAFIRKWNVCSAHDRRDCRRCDAWTPKYPDTLVTPLYEGGRDGKAFKDLAAAWGEDVVAKLIVDFFASTDPQIIRSDYKVSVFKMHAQRLRLLACGSGLDERTAANIDAVKRGMRR